jgi:hypothetical protein
MKDKQLIAFFPVPLDEEVLEGLTQLNGSTIKILKDDISEALRLRVLALKKDKCCLLSLPMQ